MPFEIVRNDITNMCVDAIVNTANPKPVVGSGVDSGIHRAAGSKLLEARQKIGNIRVGDAAISEKHAGFAVNLGSATAGEVKQLLRQVSEKVYEQTGIRLEPEVRIW